jgi:hypothetical protein
MRVNDCSGLGRAADTTLLYLTTPLHIGVGRFDQLDQSRGIDLAGGPEPYVAHVSAGTLQQASWVREFRAPEKADIDVGFERVDMGERGIPDACRRAAVMQQFGYISSTPTDDVEPMPRDRAQFA